VTRIFIDTRERDFLAYVGDLGEVTVTNLKAGDYVIVTDDRAVMVERKSLRDFVSSFRNGRLWEQLVRMLSTEEFEGTRVVRRLLVVERGSEPLEEMSLLESSIIGAQMECIFT
jgi:ERCC4-type nuclease